MTWVIPMRLVAGKGDAGAGSRELKTLVCCVFTSSLGNIGERQKVSIFGGLSYVDLVYAEECFDLRVTVFALLPDGLCTVERRSGPSSGTELFLNEYGGHFGLVTDSDAFTQSFLFK